MPRFTFWDLFGDEFKPLALLESPSSENCFAKYVVFCVSESKSSLSQTQSLDNLDNGFRWF